MGCSFLGGGIGGVNTLGVAVYILSRFRNFKRWKDVGCAFRRSNVVGIDGAVGWA